MKITVSVVQMAVVRSQPDINLEKGETFIALAAERKSMLICFPEMWTTGFDWDRNKDLAQHAHETAARIAHLAKKYHIWINGSILAANEQANPTNTSFLFSDTGDLAGVYRKTHLFSFMHEDQYMSPGNALTIVNAPWGRMGLSICYDIRFPELFRTYALQGAQMILAPLAFPHPRLEHWKILVRARALENQLYMIGANQVGSEDFGNDGPITYFGTSCIIDPWGKTIVEANQTDETLLTATIDLEEVATIRKKMNIFQDRRPDLYKL